jgi:plasmid stability protein
MASLTLKNVPDDLLRALREAADTDRRSLNQEVIHLLSVVLGEAKGTRATSAATVKAQVAAWRELAGQWQFDIEPTTEADSVMDRRSSGREVEF